MPSNRASSAPAVTAALLTLTVALAGCASLDDLAAARLPDGALGPGWGAEGSQTQEGEIDAGPFTVAAWRSLIYEHDDRPKGIIAVVTVTDVMFADEEGRIRDQFRQRLQDEGVDRTERRSGEMSVDGETASYTLYDADIQDQQQQADAKGFVLEYTYKCDAEDTVVGFLGIARTEVQTAVGTSTDESTWEEIAGSDWQQSFGGMSTSVRCSGA